MTASSADLLFPMQQFLDRIAAELKVVHGVEAIVLGGSRARGLHTEASDYDIGLYYDTAQTFDIGMLNAIARRLDDEHRANVCTPLGGWGPWVNGGGWLKVDGVAVDFIYRDIRRVSQVIEDCCAGKLVMGIQAGHPYGFISSIYMGELATCRVLWERSGAMNALKAKTRPYPPALKKAVFNAISWEPRFCADLAEKGIHKQDAAYVAGCFFRAVTGVLHTLAAINGVYVLNEKGLTDLAATFAITPRNVRLRVAEVFALMSAEPAKALALLRELIEDVDALREHTLTSL